MPRARISMERRPAICSPASRMWPVRGGIIPKMVLSSVDLPAPFAPMIDTMCPGWTRSDTPRRTSTSSYPAHTPSSSRRSAAKIGLDDPGVAPDGGGRPLGDLLAVVQDDHALGDVHHDVHVVLDQEHGLA